MSLTSALRDPASVLSRFLREHFPALAALQHDVRAGLAGVRTIQPSEPLGLHASAVGTAFDWRLRYYVSARPARDLQVTGAAPGRWGDLLASLDDAVRRTRPVGRRLNRFEEDLLNRYCLVLALQQSSADLEAPLSTAPFPLERGERGGRDLLALAPTFWLDDLRALSWAAHEALGELWSRPAVVSPTFTGGVDVGGAIGDLILDDCLVEVKTTLAGHGERAWIEQLLGYLLLDYPDRFRIRSVGLYLARQATLIRWPLDQILGTPLHDGLARLGELRLQLREHLGGPTTPRLCWFSPASGPPTSLVSRSPPGPRTQGRTVVAEEARQLSLPWA